MIGKKGIKRNSKETQANAMGIKNINRKKNYCIHTFADDKIVKKKYKMKNIPTKLDEHNLENIY